MLCIVHAALRWSLCTLLLRFVVHLLWWHFFFQRRQISSEKDKARKSTPIHSMYRIWPVPYLGKTKGTRGSLYSTRILSHLLLFPEHVRCQSFLHLAIYLTLTPTTTTNCSDYISLQLSLPLDPVTPRRSSMYIPSFKITLPSVYGIYKNGDWAPRHQSHWLLTYPVHLQCIPLRLEQHLLFRIVNDAAESRMWILHQVLRWKHNE